MISVVWADPADVVRRPEAATTPICCVVNGRNTIEWSAISDPLDWSPKQSRNDVALRYRRKRPLVGKHWL